MRWVLVSCVVFVCLGPCRVNGQTSNGSIRGHAKDEQSAFLRAVRITATSANTPSTYTVETDDEGFYRLLDLPPGTYTLTAELEGFSEWMREGITVRAGLNLSLDIVMRVGAVSEVLAIKADSPLLESVKAEHAFNISGTLQRELPLSARRNWSDAMFLVPGTVRREGGTLQNGTFTVHGATNDSNLPQVDGVDVGAVNQSSFSYTSLSVEAISDVQVKTAAVDASTPLAWGAVLNVVTKSGTNQLAGTVGFALQPNPWLDNNAAGGTTSGLALFQPDVTLGGPLKRDRWWFFGSYRYTRASRSLDRTALQLARLRSVVPDFEPFRNEARGSIFTFKTDAAFGERHRASAGLLYDRVPVGSGSTLDTARFVRTLTGGPAVSSRVLSVWSSTLVSEVTAAFNSKTIDISLEDDSRQARVVHENAIPSAGRLMGTGAIANLDNRELSSIGDARKATIGARLMLYMPRRAGSHDLDAGVYLQPIIAEDRIARYVNGGAALEEVIIRQMPDGALTLVPFHRRTYDTDEFTMSALSRSDTAVYIQDRWRPIDALSISAGLRVDFVRRRDNIFDVETQSSTEIGPRVGVNYLVTDRQTARAHFGRVHELPTRQTLSIGSTAIGFVDQYDVNLDGTFETTLAMPGSTIRRPDRIVDPDYHQPFTDEWGFGYRLQLPASVTADVGVVRRQYLDRDASVEVNGLYSGGVFVGYRDESVNDILFLTNDRWSRPVYTAVEATVTRQAAAMQLFAAYTRQWHVLTGTWRPNDVASIIQPGAFPNKRGVEFLAQNNSYAAATFFNEAARDHLARLACAVNVPMSMQVAVNYAYQSGHWSGPIITNVPTGDPAFGPPLVRLSTGRFASNPLNTTLRFANPTRADGQFRLDGVHFLSLRAAKRFVFTRWNAEVAMDIFNLGNLDGFQAIATGGHQTFSPVFRTGSERQFPRSAQLSVKASF